MARWDDEISDPVMVRQALALDWEIGLPEKTKDHSVWEWSMERVTGFEPVNGSLGSYCLTTWLHPLEYQGL